MSAPSDERTISDAHSSSNPRSQQDPHPPPPPPPSGQRPQRPLRAEAEPWYPADQHNLLLPGQLPYGYYHLPLMPRYPLPIQFPPSPILYPWPPMQQQWPRLQVPMVAQWQPFHGQPLHQAAQQVPMAYDQALQQESLEVSASAPSPSSSSGGEISETGSNDTPCWSH